MNTIFIILLSFVYLGACARHPVLLVPGLGGCGLNAKYISTSGVKPCHAVNSSFQIWIGAKYFLPLTIDCAINLLKLEYNVTGHSTHNPKYCEIEVPGFGRVDSMAYLTKMKIFLSAYYIKIINDLKKNLGYTPNVDIRGAPYDFRKGPNEMKSYLLNVRHLIEEMFDQSNGTSVVIIAHSMGGLHILRLLNDMTQAWKDKYIRSYISIASPYAGAPVTLQAVLSGVKSIAYFIAPIKVRRLERTWPSLYYLMPNKQFWSNDTLIYTRLGNFAVNNISEALKMAKIDFALEIYGDVKRNSPEMKPPGVETHCLLSSEKKTVVALDYRNVNFPDGKPKLLFSKGDGTVPLNSMMVCPHWKTQQRQAVILHAIPGVKHFDMVKNRRTIQVINEIMSKLNS